MSVILNFTCRKLRPKERAAGAIELAPLAEQDVRQLLRGKEPPHWRAARLSHIAAQIQALRGEPCQVLLDRSAMRDLIASHMADAGVGVYEPRSRSRRDVAEVRRLIEAAGLSQLSAAQQLGLSARAMQGYCSHERTDPVPPYVLLALKYLGLHPGKVREANARREALGLPPLEP